MKNSLNKLASLVIKYPIYIGVVAITFFVRETYPFSIYPMYSNFPNWSYTFYFEDQKRIKLKSQFNEDYKKVFDGITAAQNKFIEERYPTSIFYLFLALRYQKVDSIFQILNQQK